MASAPPSVVVAGEALWDGLPGGLFLGGAPCNVGVHCTQRPNACLLAIVCYAAASHGGDTGQGRGSVC